MQSVWPTYDSGIIVVGQECDGVLMKVLGGVWKGYGGDSFRASFKV